MCREPPCSEARECLSSDRKKDNDSNNTNIIIVFEVEEAVLSAAEGAITEAVGGAVRRQLRRRLQPGNLAER